MFNLSRLFYITLLDLSEAYLFWWYVGLVALVFLDECVCVYSRTVFIYINVFAYSYIFFAFHSMFESKIPRTHGSESSEIYPPRDNTVLRKVMVMLRLMFPLSRTVHMLLTPPPGQQERVNSPSPNPPFNPKIWTIVNPSWNKGTLYDTVYDSQKSKV